MDDDFLALLAEIREATKQVKDKADSFATIGYTLLEAIESSRHDPAGLLAIYGQSAEPPFDLDQPFLWHLEVEVHGQRVVYGELFRRLKALEEERLMGDVSA